MRLRAGSTIVFAGDSITDCGRERPTADGGGLGAGYVLYVDALLQATYPERRLRIVNAGIGGNTVVDLDARWGTDVLAFKPAIVSVMIGINDVWRQFDRPNHPHESVDPERYENTLHDLLARTRPQVEALVLMSPFVIEPRQDDPFRARMDLYGDIAAAQAEAHGATFVDVQAAFDQLCETLHPTAIAWDRIHPNAFGQMAIARAWLDAVGYEWAGAIEAPLSGV